MKKEEIPRYRIRVHHQWNEIQTIKCNGGAWVQYEDHLKQLSEMEEKLKRAYTAITNTYVKEGSWCAHCGRAVNRYTEHEKNCIVLEAQTWLEDKE